MDILKVKINGQWVGIPAITGDSGRVHIRYAAAQPTQDSDMKTTPDAWIGVYSGFDEVAPTTYTSYTWYEFKGAKGDKGDKGDPVSSQQVEAAVGGWLTDNPQTTSVLINEFLEDNFTNPLNPPLDRTLSSNLSAAPADLVGDFKKQMNSSMRVDSALVTMSGTNNYVNNDGGVYSNNQFDMSNTISLSKGETIKFTAQGYNTSVAVLAKLNTNNRYTCLIPSIGSYEYTYFFTAYADMSVVISTNINVSPVYSIYTSKIDDNKERITNLEDGVNFYTPACVEIEGEYIDSNSTIQTSWAFSHTAPIPVVAGDIVKVTAAGYSTNVAMISTCDALLTSATCVVPSIDSDVHEYYYNVESNGYIAASYDNRQKYSRIYKSVTIYREGSSVNVNYKVDKKIDKPTTSGSAGQVLGLNSNLDPVWINQSGGGDFEENEAGVRSDVPYTSTAKKYIDFHGQVVSNNAFSYTSPIAVNAGDYVEVYAKGYTTNVCMIATCSSIGSNINVQVISNDSTLKSYYYQASANEYIMCSYSTDTGCKITIRTSKSNKVLDQRVDTIEQSISSVNSIKIDADINTIAEGTVATIGTSGKYIRSDGVLETSGNFNLMSAISLPANSVIKFNARGYLDAVSVLAKVNTNNTYMPLIVSSDNDEHDFTYRTYDAVNVVISTNSAVSPIYSIYTSKIDELDGKLNIIEEDLFAYASMGVIGDSLASGASNYTGGAIDRPAYSWGKCIERMYGIDVTLFSRGGLTTRSWLTDSNGLSLLQSSNPADCYVIGLGQNDQYSLGINYLGSVSDVHVGNEQLNSDTYYGNYSKIIAAIKTKSPRAKIFCLTNARQNNEVKAAFNNAIKTIVPLYSNTYLIDLAIDSLYSSNTLNRTWNGAHYTAIGYKIIAKNIHDNICKIMRQNIEDFKDIQWIIDDHP